MNKTEILDLIDDLNNKSFENNTLDFYSPFEYRSCGWNLSAIYFMGEKHGRTISWSDNGEQPDSELLLLIQFPTGAYIFGEDYPKELFQKFFRELIDLKPKYTDIRNSCLYFPMENAGNVYNQFNEIYKKYQDINKEDYKQRKIQKIKDELAKLENEK